MFSAYAICVCGPVLEVRIKSIPMNALSIGKRVFNPTAKPLKTEQILLHPSVTILYFPLEHFYQIPEPLPPLSLTTHLT